MPNAKQPASWVIVRLSDSAAVFETFEPGIVAALDAAKYRAVPILDYLQALNRRIKQGSPP